MLFLLATLGALEWVRTQIMVRVSQRIDALLGDRLFDLSFRQALVSGGAQSGAQTGRSRRATRDERGRRSASLAARHRSRAGGPAARLRFSGFERSRVPEVMGTVRSVSADRIENPAAGTAYYLARVEIDSSQVELLDGVELVPGMPVEAMINTGSRTLLGYLWEPVSESVTRSFRED